MKIHELTKLKEDQSVWARLGIPSDELKQLAAKGFDISLPLYHGSREHFTQFDTARATTARHLYTSPDPRTAGYYGSIVYICVGRSQPQADLVEDYALIKKVSEIYAEEVMDRDFDDEKLEELKTKITQQLIQQGEDETVAGWEAEKDPRYLKLKFKVATAYMAYMIQSGELYDLDGRLQDRIMNELFDMSYSSVRFNDHNSEGDSDSVVFCHPEDVMILGKLKPLRESIEEWNGKTVVASVNGFKIAVDDAHAVSYITAWSDDNHCVGKLYTRRTPDKIGKEYLSIELVEVEKKYRGNGIALALFRSLIEHMAPKWKGISSYLPDQVNKKQISYIFSKLGGYEIDDYMMVDR